jgi:hypothetical protein
MIMRRMWAAGAAIVVCLALGGVPVVAQEEAAVSGAAVAVTGTASAIPAGAGSSEEVDGVQQALGVTYQAVFDASDPRASGSGPMTMDASLYPNADPSAGRGPELSWGTIRFENDEGAWDGGWAAFGLGTAASGVSEFWFTGEGAFEGHTLALRGISDLVIDEGGVMSFDFDGWIFPSVIPVTLP